MARRAYIIARLHNGKGYQLLGDPDKYSAQKEKFRELKRSRVNEKFASVEFLPSSRIGSDVTSARFISPAQDKAQKEAKAKAESEAQKREDQPEGEKPQG